MSVLAMARGVLEPGCDDVWVSMLYHMLTERLWCIATLKYVPVGYSKKVWISHG